MDLEIEVLKMLENKIRINQGEERYFVRLLILEIIGFFISSDIFQKNFAPEQMIYIIVIYPFTFLPYLILEIHRINEILAAGGYIKALEENINKIYQKKVIFWESKIVSKYLRDDIGSVIFWLILVGMPIFVSIIMYIMGYKIIEKEHLYPFQSLLLVISIVFFLLFFIYIIFINYKIANTTYNYAYKDAKKFLASQSTTHNE